MVKRALCDIEEDLESETEEGRVEVFLREKYWIMARRIIDEDGNPWRPTSDVKTERSALGRVKGHPTRFENLLT